MGTTTLFWMSIRPCCSSCTGGMLRSMMTLQGLPAAACFSTHLRLRRLGGKSLMKVSCGMPHLSTMMRRSSRSFLRISSTWPRTVLHSFSIALAVKRMVISFSVMACCVFT